MGERFSFDTIIKTLYFNDDRNKQVFKILKHSDISIKDLFSLGSFSKGTEKWDSLFNGFYYNPEKQGTKKFAGKNNNIDLLMFVHLGNIKSLSLIGLDSISNSDKTALNNGNEGKAVNNRETIKNELDCGYKSKSPGSKYGQSIDSIMDLNEYLVEAFCLNRRILRDHLNSLIFDSVSSDDTFLYDKEKEDSHPEKPLFINFLLYRLSKIDEKTLDLSSKYMNRNNDKILGEVLGWLVVAAILRDKFIDIVGTIPYSSAEVKEGFSLKWSGTVEAINNRLEIDARELLQTCIVEQLDESLLPIGTYEGDKGKINTDLFRFIQTVRRESSFVTKHIVIIGEGGIGKSCGLTHILRSEKYNTDRKPTIYIPLSRLSPNGNDQIRDIDWYLSRYYHNEIADIYSMAEESLENDFNITLYLDGYNELSIDSRRVIDDSISLWANFPGVQIIISSRSMPDDSICGFNVFHINSLTRETVKRCLEKNGILETDEELMNIFSTPLLLQLFIYTKNVGKQIDFSYLRFLRLKDTKKGIDIFWNYIQLEIYKFLKKRNAFTSLTNNKALMLIESDLFYVSYILCPYIAWKMVSENIGSGVIITAPELKIFISECISNCDNYTGLYGDCFNEINTELEAGLPDERLLSQRANVYYQLLTKMNFLFRRLDENVDSNSYVLFHQNIRDYLVAFHINNMWKASPFFGSDDFDRNMFFNEISGSQLNENICGVDDIRGIREKYIGNDNLIKIEDKYVLKYLSDMISDNELNYVWESNKISKSTKSFYEAYNPEPWMFDYCEGMPEYERLRNDIYLEYMRITEFLLKLYGVRYKNDYSDVDFSNMDLTYINLSFCKSDNSIQLTIPKEASKFNNTTISHRTFESEGHRDKVDCISVIDELAICISGDSSGKIFAFNTLSGSFLFELKTNGSLYRGDNRVTDIKWVRKNKYYIVACGYTDGKIYLYKVTKDDINRAISYKYLQRTSECRVSSEDHSANNVFVTTFDFFIDKKDKVHIIGGTSVGKIVVWGVDDYEIEFEISDLYNDEYNTGDEDRQEGNGIVASLKSQVTSYNSNNYINKLLLYETDRLYCVTCQRNGCLYVWDITEKNLIKKIKINNKKRATDKYSYIEDSVSRSKDIWNNTKKGITDIALYSDKTNNPMICFSDSDGFFHVVNPNKKSDRSHRVKGGHNKCINMIDVYDKNNVYYAITCANDGLLIKWDLTNEIKVAESTQEHKDWVMGVKVIDDKIVSYGHDNSIHISDLYFDHCYTINQRATDWIVFGMPFDYYNSKNIITGDASGGVCAWNINSKSLIYKNNGYLNKIFDVKKFIHDKRKMLAIASADGIIRICDVEERRCIQIIEKHVGWVNYIHPCCNGTKLISCGSDKKIFIHDLNDINNIVSLELNGHDDWVLDNMK